MSEERLFSVMIRDDMWIGRVRLRESPLHLFCDVHVEQNRRIVKMSCTSSIYRLSNLI